jgi:integrase
MVMSMVRPTKRKGTGNAQFRMRVPVDLLPIVRGESFTVDLPETTAVGSPTFRITTTISAEIVFSLRTADKRLITARQMAALSHVTAFLDSASRGPQDLSHKDLTALLGMVHSALVAEYEANPPAGFTRAVGDQVETWHELEVWDEIIRNAERYAAMGNARGRGLVVVEVSRVIDVDAFLRSRPVILSPRSYSDFIEALPGTLMEVKQTLAMRSAGDYTPKPSSDRYPAWKGDQRTATSSAAAGHVRNFDDLFARWKNETNPAPSTISTWQGYVNRFTAFVEHSDPHSVTRQDALRWKDALVAEGRQKVNFTFLAALHALYRYGLANAETTGLTVNPFADVKAKQKAVAGTSRRAFTDAEVTQILTAARLEKLGYLRWIPWLQAQTGARVGEIAQLWGSMVVEQEGVHCLHITPASDGGTLKNEGSERYVPLHPTLIADGFLDFVKARGNGPLFYAGKGRKAATARTDGANKHPSKGVSNRIAEWIRGTVKITDPRTGPTHSFRHWTKTALQEAGCPDSIADAIQGHAARSEGDSYRHTRPATMLAWVEKLELDRIPPNAPREGALLSHRV